MRLWPQAQTLALALATPLALATALALGTALALALALATGSTAPPRWIFGAMASSGSQGQGQQREPF